MPLQPRDVHGGAEIPLQPMEDPTLPYGKQGLVGTYGTVERSRFAGRTCDVVMNTSWSSLLLMHCTPDGNASHCRSSYKTVSGKRDLMVKQGKSVRGPL